MPQIYQSQKYTRTIRSTHSLVNDGTKQYKDRRAEQVPTIADLSLISAGAVRNYNSSEPLLPFYQITKEIGIQSDNYNSAQLHSDINVRQFLSINCK